MPKVLTPRFGFIVFTLVFAIFARASFSTAQREESFAVNEVPTPLAFAIAPTGEPEGAYFDLTMQPGEQQTHTAALVNAGDSVFEARTFAADAYTIVNGGFDVREDGSEPTGVTTWIDYSSETVAIDPGKTVERGFTVTVPGDTLPGEYITGIVLQTAKPIAVSGSTTFDQILRKTVAVFVTVPGPIEPGIEIGNVSVIQGESWSTLVVEVANTGNVLVRPTGTITLRNDLDAPVLNAPVVMGPVYAGHATTIEILIQEQMPSGELTIEIELIDESQLLSVSANAPITVALLAIPVDTPQIAISAVALTPQPTIENVQYVEIGVQIANSGEPVSNGRLTLHVTRDGQPVEDYALASSLALPTGATHVLQRYIPAEGWRHGVYGFALTLETVEASTEVLRVIATYKVDATVDMP